MQWRIWVRKLLLSMQAVEERHDLQEVPLHSYPPLTHLCEKNLVKVFLAGLPLNLLLELSLKQLEVLIALSSHARRGGGGSCLELQAKVLGWDSDLCNASR